MPSIEVGGVSLHYEEKGTGPAMVFSHGIPTDYRAWEKQMEDLSREFRTVSYSRRYAYPNKREGDLSDSTIENNAADLRGFIEKLGAGPVHLVGHSYGGFVAAYLASSSPELVRSLILVEPAIATLLVEDPSSSAQLLSLLLRSPSVAISARRFQNGSLTPSLAALSGGDTEKAVRLNVDGVQDRQGAFGEMPDPVKSMMIENARTIAELKTKLPPFKDQAGKIRARTLVVNGADSAPWLRKIGQLAAGAIPKSKAVEIPGSRHFPHIENHTEFNRWVRTFVAEG